MPTQPNPATDSATELRPLIGDDATATFEDDPKFVDSNPGGSGSSENVEEQREGAAAEFQAAPSKSGKGAGPDADEEDDFSDDEDDEDEDYDDDDDDEEDDEDFEDDDEDDLDDEDEEYDEDEDDDEEDEDEDGVEASASSLPGTMRADGLLGYEDEAEDAKNRVDRVTGDVQRKRDEARKLTDDPDDAFARVNPRAEREEQDDSDVVIRPVKPMDLAGAASASHATL